MFRVQIAASLDVTSPPFIKADHIAFQLLVTFYGAPILVAVETFAATMVTVREIVASSLLFFTTRFVFRFFRVLVVPLGSASSGLGSRGRDLRHRPRGLASDLVSAERLDVVDCLLGFGTVLVVWIDIHRAYDAPCVDHEPAWHRQGPTPLAVAYGEVIAEAEIDRLEIIGKREPKA